MRVNQLLLSLHILAAATWIGAVVVALAIGGAFLIPEGRRLAELARMPGHDSSEIRDRARRRFLVARVDLFVLILGLVAMVFRPGG